MHQPLLAHTMTESGRRRGVLTRSGFTMLELVVVLGIVCVLGAMAAVVMPSAVSTGKSDSAMTRVVSTLRTAREQAISQRRNIRVVFNAPNQIVVSRVEVPSGTTTTIATVWLESGMRFVLPAGAPDTPDAFGNAAATSFGSATSIAFTSEGQLIDQHGDPVNGSVFLGRYNDATSARAVTIFGPTALIRQWRWNGGQWTS
jgi:prepilin-type N-terminal cleavage/methylation domain-containing protein